MAQKSADEMMKWTLSMHEIAIETKQETLSMHVITVFTLVFLPGTFLAVRRAALPQTPCELDTADNYPRVTRHFSAAA